MKLIDVAVANTKIVTDKGQTLLYAGLGTFSLIEENTVKAFDTLVEKGQKTERPKAIKTPEKIMSLTNRLKEQGQKVEEKLQGFMNIALHRFGIPSRDEVHLLIKRVESLTKKIDCIKA